jgi:hypothetical protein
MKGNLIRKMDKPIEETNVDQMDDSITRWMETITEVMFKIIIFFGIPYFLYILAEFFLM